MAQMLKVLAPFPEDRSLFPSTNTGKLTTCNPKVSATPSILRRYLSTYAIDRHEHLSENNDKSLTYSSQLSNVYKLFFNSLDAWRILWFDIKYLAGILSRISTRFFHSLLVENKNSCFKISFGFFLYFYVHFSLLILKIQSLYSEAFPAGGSWVSQACWSKSFILTLPWVII